MKLEKVGDLRALINENKGQVCIGELVIRRAPNADLDVHLAGGLIAYVHGGAEDESGLGNCLTIIRSYTDGLAAQSELAAAKQEAEDARSAEQRLSGELTELTATAAAAAVQAKVDIGAAELRGRLAAYEDLLGRAVSIAPRA